MNEFDQIREGIDSLASLADAAALLYKTDLGRIRLLESQFAADQATIATLRARVAQLEAEQGLSSQAATDPFVGLMVQIAHLTSALNAASTEALRLASLRGTVQAAQGEGHADCKNLSLGPKSVFAQPQSPPLVRLPPNLKS